MDSFYFFFFFALIKTSKPMLNISVRVGIRALFLILEEMLLAFHHWVWYQQ